MEAALKEARRPLDVIEINLMTGMSVVGDLFRKWKNVSSSSGEICKGNETSSGLFRTFYRSRKRHFQSLLMVKFILATVKGDVP